MKQQGKYWILGGLFLIMTFVNMFQHTSNFFEGLGASVVSLLIWGILGGLVVFNVLLAIYNLLKPENTLALTIVDRINFGLFTGIVLKLVFDLKF